MSAGLDGLLSDAMRLSERERLILATELMSSVSRDLPGMDADDPNFLEELDRRSNDGQPTVAWEEIRDGLRAELKK